MAKRALDIFLAISMLLLSLALWPLIALAIKITDGGPVFFCQERWGRSGATFKVIKFRSMDVASSVSDLAPATVDDPRVTSVGRVLRKTGLDELPQLINIVKGEMSFVGPRALAVAEPVLTRSGRAARCEEVPGFAERLVVLPGLTGRTTIYLPKDAPAEAKFESDLEYIKTRTLRGDIRLIMVSFAVSFRGRWETRSNKVAR